MTKSTVNAAVSAAKTAFPAWGLPKPRSALGPARQGGLAHHGARRRSRPLAVAREEGKTLPEGKGEVMRAARIFKFFAGEALRRHGVTVDSTRPGVAVETYREPLGVFGLITPWNFPIAIPAWKSAPALAFGNTVVIKPASLTPATSRAHGNHPRSRFPERRVQSDPGWRFDGRRARRAPRHRRRFIHGRPEHGAGVAKAAMSHNARVQLRWAAENPLVVLDDCRSGSRR